MPFHEVDELGFEAPAPVGHPGRANLPDGHPTGPKLGERLPGQRKAPFAGAPHLRRLVLRKVRSNPLGARRSVLNQMRLELRARWRQRRAA